MSVLASQPSSELLGLKSQELRDMFAENGDDVSNPANEHMGHDHQNELAQDAKAGWSTGKHTAIAQNDERAKKAFLDRQTAGLRSAASGAEYSLSQNFNISLKGIKLDDAHMVNINDDGVLMVRGEGADSEFREATVHELVQVETESAACSVAVTQDQLDMNAYLNGETDILPDALHKLAEENGLVAENVSPEEFKTLVEQRFANSPHIANSITGEYVPGSLNLNMDINTLTAPKADAPREGLPAAPSGVADGLSVRDQFMSVVSPQTQPDTPNITPMPAVAPTNAPSPMTPAGV